MNKPIEFELMDHLIDARYAKSEEARRTEETGKME
jgi:hypothetical protein